MRFTIVKNTGTNRPPQLSYDFIPPGGTIGNSTDNHWVLPVQGQSIAPLQIIVSTDATGRCCITNRSASSEILLNTIPMTPDRQIEIHDGDMLNIGDYQIQVASINQSLPPVAETRMVDAKPLDTLSKNKSQNMSSQTSLGINSMQPSRTHSEDIPNEVWEGLENIFTPFNPTLNQEKHPISNESYDNNPLINTGQQEERNPIDPLEKMETKINLDSLQSHATEPVAMFNPNGNLQQENILNNPSPSTLAHQSNFSGNHSDRQEVDPLVLFTDKSASDKYGFDKHTRKNIKNNNPLSLILDNAEPLASSDKTEPPDPPAIRHQDQDNVPSFAKILSSPPPPLFTADNSVHCENSADQDDNYHLYDNKANERLNIDPIEAQVAISYSSQSDEIQLEGKLLTALLDGMGIGHIKKPQFDEHVMYQLGKLLSLLSQGIMALNASRLSLKNRILLKSHTNSDVTQIKPDANNPFQLLPSGQAVLVQMFGDHMPGFMSPEESTRDILIELQAHQLGIIAGMIHDMEKNNISFGENFLQSYEAEINRYKKSQDKKRN
ncbi:putative FHA domain protein [Xenorhabdus mauleonii]|uniref:FHA domain protein n=1 Tax=Xenorhabdus mauleonii TaxID=351675 RepID=A0A1I3NM70_9GAMM|nr:FHA domain-containing protein [Xenorhabdus mauleonii]PHM45643.1 putative FHA domain protein [Xenorhabdus mauleonii]SFJ10040.1 FHA domain-containing protein [Xenorhabdus mauleonii]